MGLQEEWLISFFLCRTFAASKVLLQSVCAAPAKQRMKTEPPPAPPLGECSITPVANEDV